MMSVRALLCLLPLLAPLAGGSAQVFSDLTAPLPMKAGDTLIIGFLGGWDKWNDPNRAVTKLAIKLRALPAVRAESIENHQRHLATRLVRQALDYDVDGTLDENERASARIILYGQSMGGAAVVKFARELQAMEIPVVLTVQIDSWGIGDGIIPPNVASAANFYQRELLSIRGQPSIQAEDPQKTRILGNFRKHYPMGSPNNPRPESLRRRMFGGGHARMEADPAVWAEVESLIVGAMNVPRSEITESAAR